jgi:predicted CoA-binding protein
MKCQIPTISSNKDEMKEFFENTKNIAIIGLSPVETKDSNKVGKYLQQVGFKIYPIYPRGDFILNEKVYKNLNDIDDKIDMVVVFRKPEAVEMIVDAILKREDIKFLWNQIGVVNDEAVKKVIPKGIKVIQNRCVMIEHKALSQ